jgi:hypothetical protein
MNIHPRRATTLQIQGGLGNQLFSYIAAVLLALNTNSSLRVDTSDVSDGYTHRNFDLGDLEPVYDFEAFSRPRLASRKIYNRLRWYFYKYTFLGKFIYFISSDTGRNLEFEKLQRPVIVRGYFQCWRYASSCETILGKLNFVVRNASETYKDLLAQIGKSQPIVVHVRRGDYLSLADSFGVLSTKYFNDAVANLRSSGLGNPIWLFSDSAEASFLKKFDFVVDKFVDPSFDLTPAETLVLMSKGKAFVISNSSFSWWAAYIASNNSPVIAPSKWFRALPDPEDLIPSSWTRLESHWAEQ